MSFCACCSIMSGAWPLLCGLTETQRSHVAKNFRVTEEKEGILQRFVRAVFCMPCSLLQVHMLLDECKHELCVLPPLMITLEMLPMQIFVEISCEFRTQTAILAVLH